MTPGSPKDDLDRKALRDFVAEDSRLESVRLAAGASPAWLVGGSVRDLLLGRRPSDIDVVIEGDPIALAGGLDPEPLVHPRFMTATVSLDDGQLDIARARAETYPAPGALPEVEPAPIERDLARRDFTINAVAVPLSEPDRCLDPFDGLAALAERRLTLLHPASLVDDPIRALRGARYAARFGFEPDRTMRIALADVDLDSVSEDRLVAELRRFGSEPEPARAVAVALEWGLLEAEKGTPELVEQAIELVSDGPWQGFAEPAGLVESALRSIDLVLAFPKEVPGTRIELYELASRSDPEILVLARAAGREWLDWWPETGAGIRLEIDGDDLVAVGIEPGPAIGAGLRAALAEALEVGGTGRAGQLATATRAAGEALGG